MFDTHGREVGYATGHPAKGQEKLRWAWLRENPHRLHLGPHYRLHGVCYAKTSVVIEQTLDLWTGNCTVSFASRTCRSMSSRSSILNVIACVYRWMANGPLAIAIEVPIRFAGYHRRRIGNRTDRHRTIEEGGQLRCELDADEVLGTCHHGRAIRLESRRVRIAASARRRTLEPRGRVLAAVDRGDSRSAGPRRARRATIGHWRGFWQSGAAIDFSGSRDPRAKELERRTVLSQYLTAIQSSELRCPRKRPDSPATVGTASIISKCTGGMLRISRCGIAANFSSAAWVGITRFCRQREKAKQQGYTGARWPKMTAPDGRGSPSPVGEMLISAATPSHRHRRALLSCTTQPRNAGTLSRW